MSPPFSQDEIELAQLLKAYGLSWTPCVGHYVLDQSGLIEVDSPFQDRVYFILDLKHFLRRSETLERLAESMCWLPTYEQCRQVLDHLMVGPEAIRHNLQQQDVIENRSERLVLYRLIEAAITGEV